MKPLLLSSLLTMSLFACHEDGQETDAYGNFETTEIYISAEVAGKLLGLHPSEGDRIQKNELIASLDSTQLYLKKRQLQATVEALKSKLQNVPVQLDVYNERMRIMERELQRVQALLADGAATQKQLDDLQGELLVVRSQVAATENQLSTANRGILAEIRPLEWQIAQLDDQIARSQVRSPMSGVVLEKFKEPGELVVVGQPLVKIADLDRMILRGYVSGSLLSGLSVGQAVTVLVDGADGAMNTYEGSISWISPKAEFTPKIIQTREERVNLVYAVKFRVKNDGYLKIGMPGEVLFNRRSAAQ